VATFEKPTLNINFRVWCAFGCAAAAVFVLIIRLWYLQIVKGDYFRDRSENNRLRTVYIPSPRGLILDRQGEVLARNRPAFNVDFVTEDSKQPKETVADLAALTNVDVKELNDRLVNQNKRRRFEPKLLLKDISRDLVAQVSVQRYRLPGVIINVVPSREYVHGELGAHVIGYTREINGEQLKNPQYAGYRMGDVVGQAGIEAKWERYLRGERGSQAVIVNASGNKIGEAFFEPEIPGHNILLTIDRKLQETADRALSGLRGAIVALDPTTGDVLAISSSPRFDPNMFTSEISKDQWADLVSPKETKLNNRAVQGAYPPGSVFKIFVSIAILAEQVASPSESTFCPGSYQFGRRAFKCHKHSGHGSATMYDSIVQSCDVYFYIMGQRLGVDRIHDYARMFGFGEVTGVDLSEENAGLVPSTEWKKNFFKEPEDKRWYPGETLPVAIGQGAVTTTPIQIARSLAAVVNGGKVLRPRVVRRVSSSDGRVFEEHVDPEVVRDLSSYVDGSILREVRRGMEGVVADKRGTGHRAALPDIAGIAVGGKTGTSQVGTKDEDHAWFAGYAPANDPKIVVVALVENGGHGGATAAPLVKQVMGTYFGVDLEAAAEKKGGVLAPAVARLGDVD
jgi:penicillin-binding protein 2